VRALNRLLRTRCKVRARFTFCRRARRRGKLIA